MSTFSNNDVNDDVTWPIKSMTMILHLDFSFSC